MNIIIEGPDATGKTTIADKILAKHKLSVLHDTGKTKNDKYYYFDLLHQDNFIFDRFHLSEYIFPQIYGRAAKLTWQDFNFINEEQIKTNTYFILFITSDMNVLNERLKARGEYNYLEEIIPQNELFTLYADYLKKYNYNNFIVVDIANLDNYKILDDWLIEKGLL